eukprot:s919_g22.t1
MFQTHQVQISLGSALSFQGDRCLLQAGPNMAKPASNEVRTPSLTHGDQVDHSRTVVATTAMLQPWWRR